MTNGITNMFLKFPNRKLLPTYLTTVITNPGYNEHSVITNNHKNLLLICSKSTLLIFHFQIKKKLLTICFEMLNAVTTRTQSLFEVFFFSTGKWKNFELVLEPYKQYMKKRGQIWSQSYENTSTKKLFAHLKF